MPASRPDLSQLPLPVQAYIESLESEIIRFSAGEVPPKENVVQGVQCMSLRSDETCAATAACPWPTVPSST